MKDELNAALRLLEIREPMKSLVDPVLEFHDFMDGYFWMSVHVKTFDAITGACMKRFPAGRFPITRYLAGRYTRKPLDLACFVKRCLLSALAHEIDESMWRAGERCFEPEHDGPSTEEMEKIREFLTWN